MATYMTDTHSLLWAFRYPRKLGENARQAFEEVANGESKLLIPVIVLAELIFTIENKPIQADFDESSKLLKPAPILNFLTLTYYPL